MCSRTWGCDRPRSSYPRTLVCKEGEVYFFVGARRRGTLASVSIFPSLSPSNCLSPYPSGPLSELWTPVLRQFVDHLSFDLIFGVLVAPFMPSVLCLFSVNPSMARVKYQEEAVVRIRIFRITIISLACRSRKELTVSIVSLTAAEIMDPTRG
jgi:hypothetical protein